MSNIEQGISNRRRGPQFEVPRSMSAVLDPQDGGGGAFRATTAK
jgi:hypothetical protein